VVAWRSGPPPEDLTELLRQVMSGVLAW
jgi:hypothetical protein